ncbi:MAG: hypothetical protein WC683_00865 [bacterium]
MAQQKETKAALAAEVARLTRRVEELEAGLLPAPRSEQVRQAAELLAAEFTDSVDRARDRLGNGKLSSTERADMQGSMGRMLQDLVRGYLVGLILQREEGVQSGMLGLHGDPHFFPFLKGLEDVGAGYVARFVACHGTSPIHRQAPGCAGD